MLIETIRLLKKRRQLRRKRLRERQIITESELFDAIWYLRHNPEVAGHPGGPLDHFLDIGAAEQRAAGPRFDTRSYLAANPDVIESRTNPLVHYIRHGISEGRGFASNRPLSAGRRGTKLGLAVDVTFSLIIKAGQPADVKTTLKSLVAQSAPIFEVIFPGSAVQAIGAFHERLAIRAVRADEDFLRAAILSAEHEFVIVLDAGDVLAVDALLILSRFLNDRADRSQACDVVYSDESQGSDAAPALKPAWSPELLTAYNYFGRLTVIRRRLALDCLPGFQGGPAEEWDLNLRVTERTGAIERLPQILCRRMVATSFTRNLALAEPEAHVAVLRAAWMRRGHEAEITAQADGTFRATWTLAKHPLVSIIIPSKNRAELLRICCDGILNRTDYSHFELIIVDNGSKEPQTRALYAELAGRGVRILFLDEAFNYSRACNTGAAAARGELLLFLNNDIEVIKSDWLDALVRRVIEPGVGLVGPKLLYPDGEIQHAGVAIGLFTFAAHAFHRAPQDVWGPIGSPDVSRNWMAVTGACQLIRRQVFDLVGGYDETFRLSYSDIVLCLDAGRWGFRTAYIPESVLVHHEGATRGHTNPPNDIVLFARRIRALGIDADPYFHPGLDTESFVPRLRSNTTPIDASALQVQAAHFGGTPSVPLNVHDDGSVANVAGVPWDTAALRVEPDRMEPGLDAAARILIGFLRRRRDIRARFPRALSDGAAGAYAAWVKRDGLSLLGLSSDFASWIDAAFGAGFGMPARQILMSDTELRDEEPLFLLPNGRPRACRTLFEAVMDNRLSEVDLWWFLVASAEDPMAELCLTWAITPTWQAAIPDGGTIFGLTKLVRWVSDTYEVQDDWIYAQTDPSLMNDVAQVRLAFAADEALRQAFPDAMAETAAAEALLHHLSTRASGRPFPARRWSADRAGESLARAVVGPGLNILGHFAYPSGLRISTESLVAGLHANGVAVSLRDVPVNISSDDPNGSAFSGCEVYGTTLIHVQPEPLFNTAFTRAGLMPRARRTYRIGYWYWEFDEMPSSWDRAAFECDELWTATEFIAQGLRKRYRQPVRVLMPGIEIAPFAVRPRSSFGLQDDTFVFLFAFHMTSVMDRKNPLGLIQAFKMAFGLQDRARLVIKTSFGTQHPSAFARLHEAADEAGIMLIDETFSRDDTLSLIAACDAYVSLHRCEGLGLSMAEAMLLGRPVVATRYSGNLDFMDDGNSLLVDYGLVTLDDDLPPYKAGLRWAEPSITHAAAQMRRLYDDPAFARDLGARAKADLERRLNYRTTGRAVAARLAEIDAMP